MSRHDNCCGLGRETSNKTAKQTSVHKMLLRVKVTRFFSSKFGFTMDKIFEPLHKKTNNPYRSM